MIVIGQMEYLLDFEVQLGWRRQYTGLMKLTNRNDGVTVYFIDNDYYFGGRNGAIYGAGDKLKTSGDELLSELQANYVDDMRRSVSHMTGWQRYRVKRMVEMYPRLLDYFARTREEIMEVADISSLLGELRFLRMDLEAFFTHEKNEMY